MPTRTARINMTIPSLPTLRRAGQAIALAAAAACADTPTPDPCSKGACTEEPDLAEQDALCAWPLAVGWNMPTSHLGAAPDVTGMDLLQPTADCRAAMEATVPWDASLPEGSPQRAAFLDALWLAFYAPLARHPDGVLLGGLDAPDTALVPYTLDSLPEGGFGDLDHPWVNHEIQRRFYDKVSRVAFVDAHVSDGVIARYGSGALTVYHTFVEVELDPSSRVDWTPDGQRYVSAGILVHEVMHGMGSAWDHELCPLDTPGLDAPACDDAATHSAYAHEAMFLDALVLGVLEASDRTGYRLVDDERLEDALDSLCDAAHRVEDWGFVTQCAWFGEGILPGYLDAITGG